MAFGRCALLVRFAVARLVGCLLCCCNEYRIFARYVPNNHYYLLAPYCIYSLIAHSRMLNISIGCTTSSSNIRAPTIIMNVEQLSPPDQQLLQASKDGDWPKIQRALAKGGNINTEELNNGPPIVEAICNKHWKVALQMMNVPGFDATAKGPWGTIPLRCLCCNSEPASSDGEKDLQLLLLHELVKDGADLHLEDCDGMCSLDFAVKNGNTSFVRYLLTAHDYACFAPFRTCEISHAVMVAFHFSENPTGYISLPVVSLLLEHGGSASVPHEDDGDTPLHITVYQHATEEPADAVSIIRLLFKKGADPNTTNKYRETALHCVAGSWNDKKSADQAVKITKLLLDNGVDRTLVNAQGKTPLQIARLSEVADILENYGTSNGNKKA